MARIYNSVTELIGGTPLLKANNFAKAINQLSDVDEGLDDEIDDLIAEASSEDEAITCPPGHIQNV